MKTISNEQLTSRFAAKALYNKQEVTAVLNFMPQMSEEEFTVFLAERARLRPQKTAEEFLTGLFQKLHHCFLQMSKYKSNDISTSQKS